MATKQVNIHEAKTQLSKLISDLREGDEVVIANRGNPVARLTVVPRHSGRRQLGQVDLGGPLSAATLSALAPLSSDDGLDEVGWPL